MRTLARAIPWVFYKGALAAESNSSSNHLEQLEEHETQGLLLSSCFCSPALKLQSPEKQLTSPPPPFYQRAAAGRGLVRVARGGRCLGTHERWGGPGGRREGGGGVAINTPRAALRAQRENKSSL